MAGLEYSMLGLKQTSGHYIQMLVPGLNLTNWDGGDSDSVALYWS